MKTTPIFAIDEVGIPLIVYIKRQVTIGQQLMWFQPSIRLVLTNWWCLVFPPALTWFVLEPSHTKRRRVTPNADDTGPSFVSANDTGSQTLAQSTYRASLLRSVVPFKSDSSGDQQTKLQQMAGRNTLTALGENRITIAELLQKQQQELAGKTIICTASITEIIASKYWFYNACPSCLQTIYESGDKWACASDGKFNAPKYMFLIVATVTDETGNVTATLFDEPVKTLVGKECSDLLIKEVYTDETMIPPPLQAIKGKVKNFHLQVQKDTYGQLEMHGKLTDPIMEEVTSATTSTAKTIPTTPKPATPSATVSAVKRNLFQSPVDGISETKRLRFPD